MTGGISNDEVQDQVEVQNTEPEVDPWEAAFAAANAKATSNTQAPAEAGNTAEAADAGNASDGNDSGNQEGFEAGDGGEVPDPSMDGGFVEPEAGAGEYRTAQEIEVEIKQVQSDIRKQVMDQTYQEMINSGKVRHVNGKLGATIEDPDICKRDRDGVPTYYNPQTGRPFTGDRPDKQAKEWVEDYNQELADSFNRRCAELEADAMKTVQPMLNVMKFEPTYAQLDPIRKSMFDNIVDDYEIKDSNGDVIGYSCDLDKVLASVNRQVRAIQAYTKTNNPVAPGTPPMDMKNSSTTASGPQQKKKIDSLAAALEAQQDALIAKKGK